MENNDLGVAADAAKPALVCDQADARLAPAGFDQAQWRGCNVPPEGWWCSRAEGHGGPCAARPGLAPIIAAALQTWRELPDDERNGERPFIMGFNAGWEEALNAEAAPMTEVGTKEDTDMETLVEALSLALSEACHNGPASDAFERGDNKGGYDLLAKIAITRLNAERLSSPTGGSTTAGISWGGKFYVTGNVQSVDEVKRMASEHEYLSGCVDDLRTRLKAAERSSPTEMREASVEALDTFEKLAADLREEDAERHAQRIAVIEIDITRLRAALDRSTTKGNTGD